MADTSALDSVRSKHIREKLLLWDDKSNAKAFLTNQQKDSIIDLTAQSNFRPLPIELPLEDFPTIVANEGNNYDQAPEQINSAQEFFEWYKQVEDEMKGKEDEHQIIFYENLKCYVEQCNKVIEETEQCLEFLTVLKTDYIRVATKTNALHEACENLLEEQTQCVNAAEHINSRLSYFSELDRISSKINAPMFSIHNEAFLAILVRIDECIEYLNQHPQYKESSTYLARFHLCLSRALSLVKTHVFNTLQNTTRLVTRSSNEKSSEDAFILLYGKFRTSAPKIKVHMERIEQRLDKSIEYKELLSECHQFYFQQRLNLLPPSISSAINELSNKHYKDHCAFVRSGCAFMLHVCEDEHNLFAQFFGLPTPALDEMLESLCMYLYDAFRPLLVHIVHLETLAELCSILKVEMLEEHMQPSNVQELVAFQKICSQMLQDVQERLVFRTHVFINREILNYNPASGDLAYPEKLNMMKSISEKIKKEKFQKQSSSGDENSFSRQDSESSVSSLASQEVAQICDGIPNKSVGFINMSPDSSTNMPMSPADLHGMWYPTVRRSLLCLSKLHRCLDRSTFQGLSQDILSLCVQSLLKAREAITENKTELDGLLFLTKHLLILREQIIPFHIDSVVKETSLDFSKIKEAAVGLIRSRSNLFSLNSNNAMLQFLLEGTPAVLEKYVDCRQEVDDQLKSSCEKFIKHVTLSFVGPLNDFLSKASVIMNKSSMNDVSLRVQPFASPEKLRDIITETYKNVKQTKPCILKSMSLYLANEDTEYILFKPIKSNVLQSFHNLHQLLLDQYTEEDRQIIGAPSIEQVNMVMSPNVITTQNS